MLAISAADAISPAIQRTREFLFAPPFRWGTFLKLCLVAAVTEGLGANFNTSPGGGRNAPSSAPNNSIFQFTPEVIAAIVACALILCVIILIIGYVVTRLRFAYFHCLVHNTREIKPGWYFYRAPAARFFLMNIGVGLLFLLAMALIFIPFAAGLWRVFKDVPPGGRPDLGMLFSLLLPLIPIIFAIVVVAFLMDIVLRDLVLPHYALENATAGEAFRAVWANMRNQKKQFFVYAILRVLLPLVGAAILFILLIIPTLISLGAVGIAEWGVHSAFSESTGGAAVAGVLIQVFIGVLAFAFAMVVGISLGGPISTGVREYALLFYGGRYQALGDAMYPNAPPAPQMAATAPAM